MMKTDRAVMSYYRYKMTNGKSALARAADFLILRTAIFSVSYVWLLYQLRMVIPALLGSLAIVILISLLLFLSRDRKLKKTVEAHQKEFIENYILEKLALMQRGDFISLVRSILLESDYVIRDEKDGAFICEKDGIKTYVKLFRFHPDREVLAQDILEAIWEVDGRYGAILLISTSKLSEKALDALLRIDSVSVDYIDEKTLLTHAKKSGLVPPDGQLEQAVLDELKAEKEKWKQLKDRATLSGKPRKYIICGAVMLIASLFTGYKLYYYAFAAICFIFAIYTVWSARRKENHARA